MAGVKYDSRLSPTQKRQKLKLKAKFLGPKPRVIPPSTPETGTATAMASDIPRRLVTPMVALVVGEEGQKHYAHEGILCSLKYFQDILEGPLKAVPEKIINMPEDPKEAVLALVECLYTGKYHFQASLENENQDMQPQDAPTSIIQMKFHAEVYKIAKKYQHQGLLVASHASVASIMKVSQHDITRLRLWKIVYSVPVMFIVDNQNFGAYLEKEWIRKLLKENRDELRDFFQEYPEFACGILDILTSPYGFRVSIDP